MGQIGSIYGGLSGKSKVDFGGGNARYVTFLGVLENIILDVRHTERVHVEVRRITELCYERGFTVQRLI